MIEVKNLLFQPLSLHTRSGHGLHLGPRQVLRLPGDDVSAEMQAAARRGAVSLTLSNAERGMRNKKRPRIRPFRNRKSAIRNRQRAYRAGKGVDPCPPIFPPA